jgi:hypothetical protein
VKKHGEEWYREGLRHHDELLEMIDGFDAPRGTVFFSSSFHSLSFSEFSSHFKVIVFSFVLFDRIQSRWSSWLLFERHWSRSESGTRQLRTQVSF